MQRKSFAAIAAAALITTPVAAAAPSAAPLSLASAQRAGDDTRDADRLHGTTAWILAAIALGLIVLGIIELTGDGTNSVPLSP
jgi:hypothetical protein